MKKITTEQQIRDELLLLSLNASYAVDKGSDYQIRLLTELVEIFDNKEKQIKMKLTDKDYEEEFNGHISDEIKTIINQCEKRKSRIPLYVYKELRINSYEQKRIIPYLSNEAFIYHLEMCLKNVSVKSSKYAISADYNTYILTEGIDELLKRFKSEQNNGIECTVNITQKTCKEPTTYGEILHINREKAEKRPYRRKKIVI